MDIPGLGMGGNDPLIQTLLGRGQAADARIADTEKELGSSREREEAARAKQQEALAPVQEKLKATLETGAPAAPAQAAIPAAPERPQLDTKEMTETLSLITALAAIGGALTRQPLTAALNNFSAGVHGLVQGKQMVFQNAVKEFEENLKKAHAENAATWQRYQAARDKYKTDIQGLQNEMKLIAAETQSPIDLELARRGDIVSLTKMREKSVADFDKVLASVGRMRAQQAAHDETVRHHKEMEKAARDREERLAGVRGDPKEQEKLTKEYQTIARRTHANMLKAWDKAKDDTTRAEVKRRYDEDMATLDAEMRSRGFAGKSSVSGATPAAAPVKTAEAPVKSFATPEEADAAAARGEIEDGARITIGGQTGTWHK